LTVPISIDEPHRTATVQAALAALQPIVALLLDAGVNTVELTRIVRWTAVTQAASLQRVTGKKPSISRIAAATGLSRAEVSQLLSLPPLTTNPLHLTPRQSDRVLSAWLNDPDYLLPSGTPKTLAYSDGIFTFSDLCRTHAPDIPPRAMLNELIAAGRVIKCVDGTFSPNRSSTQPRQSEAEAIKSFGEKLNALGTTLLRNLRNKNEPPLFERVVFAANLPTEKAKKVSREIARRCATFTQGVERYLLDQSASELAPRNGSHAHEPGHNIGVILSILEMNSSHRDETSIEDEIT
jgi:Family of unknown function (DUF6502)